MFITTPRSLRASREPYLATSSPEREQLRAAGLTPRETVCLSLYYFDGLTQEAIGEQLGMTKPGACQHIQNGLRKLAAAGLEMRSLTTEQPKFVRLPDDLAPDEVQIWW